MCNTIPIPNLSADEYQIKWIKQHPYVSDDGIYVPYKDYVLEGCSSAYKLVISKEMFVEAYNKWIKGEENCHE